ncbi:hypothetical protein HAV_00510 [Candidatus Hepatincola sp. Av]
MSKKITFIESVSIYFKIDRYILDELGIFDSSLNIDTNLFIDPLLLQHSQHPEMKKANKNFLEYYSGVIQGQLNSYLDGNDDLEKNIIQYFQFKETSGIALGYSSSNTKGKGVGEKQSTKIVKDIKKYLTKQTINPAIFRFMPIFGEGIGADKISDMTISIILNNILDFNKRVLQAIKTQYKQNIITKEVIITVRDDAIKIELLSYNNKPCILIPKDVLNKLPNTNTYWKSLIDTTVQIMNNDEEIRRNTNNYIGKNCQNIIKQITKKDGIKHLKPLLEKEKNEEWVKGLWHLFSQQKKVFDFYDIKQDKDGDATNFYDIVKPYVKVDKDINKDSVDTVVAYLISSFKSLIEDNRFGNEIVNQQGETKNEKYWQKLFFAFVKLNCEKNNIDISPETDAGFGPVDFKFSKGNEKIVVEIKLSNNKQVVNGYRVGKQLEKYVKAENAAKGYYVILDVDNSMDKKIGKLTDINNNRPKKEKGNYEFFIIDCTYQRSASKL